MSTTYAVCPFKGEEFQPGETLVVVDPFHRAVRTVLLRRPMHYEYVGYVKGDGAECLRQESACLIRLTKVSELSGCGQAVIERRHPPRAGEFGEVRK